MVYAWQSTTGSQGQHLLDTLFVKLSNPPQNMKFDGLPENIVSLVPTVTNKSVSAICQMIPQFMFQGHKLK